MADDIAMTEGKIKRLKPEREGEPGFFFLVTTLL
jgi:hypothetical protein